MRFVRIFDISRGNPCPIRIEIYPAHDRDGRIRCAQQRGISQLAEKPEIIGYRFGDGPHLPHAEPKSARMGDRFDRCGNHEIAQPRRRNDESNHPSCRRPVGRAANAFRIWSRLPLNSSTRFLCPRRHNARSRAGHWIRRQSGSGDRHKHPQNGARIAGLQSIARTNKGSGQANPAAEDPDLLRRIYGKELLDSLKKEEKRDRRRLLLDLLETHGDAARALAFEQLKELLASTNVAIDWHFAPNLVCILNGIHRTGDVPAGAEIDVVAPLLRLSLPAPLIKEAISPADPYRVRALLARWIEEGVLTVE